jgi:superfamily II DNA or RNA helicase
MDDYKDFVQAKLAHSPPTGITGALDLHPSLFPFQQDVVRWACRRGRAAIFADTGLGKTRQQLAWADAVRRHTKKRVLVLAPLAVAQQTAAEGAAMGLIVTVCRDGNDVQHGINITNYDRVHRFDPSAFGAVVLDESSIIEHHDAKTLRVLLDAFATTPFKLCATATPAPNDFTELGTHAEFLGICSRAEMLAEFFCHDGGETQKWRVKGHARVAFWKWVATWAAMIRRPSDLGYDDGAYDLPSVAYHEHTVDAPIDTYRRAGLLFADEARTLMDRRNARRASTTDRVAACAAKVNAESGEPWIVWCDLNAESEALCKAIDGAVEIRGSDTTEEKERRLVDFAAGRIRVLVTKPSIAGFGLNWQHCARVAFVGVTDSWEAYYQAVRRCWRFGQTRAVHVHVFASESEGSVIANLKRKELDAARLGEELARETGEAVRAEVFGLARESNDYTAHTIMVVPSWIVTKEDAE